MVTTLQAKQIGKDNKEFQFDYVSGSFENSFINEANEISFTNKVSANYL